MRNSFIKHSNKIRSLKILSYVLLFSLAIYSCNNENIVKPDNIEIWAPKIRIIKGDKEATLLLSDPRPYTDYAGTAPSNPDYFNILISDNLVDFNVFKKVEISTTRVLVDNLVNGKPYYFLVTAHKGENKSISSDTIMSIPSTAQKSELYFSTVNYSIERLSTSYDFGYLSFNSNDYNGSYGNMLYFMNNTSGAVSLLGANLQGSNWSPVANKLVYLTTKQEGITIYPFAMQLFDPESKISTTLFETPYNNYYVSNPTFTPSGDRIAFLSSENNSAKYIYDLWTINPVIREKIRITNFNDVGFDMAGNYSLSKSGEDVYLDGHFLGKYKIGIYKLNTSTKVFTPLLETHWNDRLPKLSPDNTKLAFISDRTGKDELWTYDLVNLKYNQITGEPRYYFDSRYTNLQWINNDQLLITVFENTKSLAVKIKVN